MTEAALSTDQCSYAGFQDNQGKLKICHYDSKQKKKKYVISKVTATECLEHIKDHVSGFPDFVAVNDNDCSGDGCLPTAAPCDQTVPCCDGLVCADANGKPAASGHCVDVDACVKSPCGDNQKCSDLPAPAEDDASGRTCACADGFVPGANGACVAPDACAGKDVDDHNACTDDTCDPKTGEIKHAPNSAACDDGNACSVGDKCSEGKCQAGENPCKEGQCKALSGEACGDWDDLECSQGGPVDDVAVKFGCTKVFVRACKDLSNVVLLFADGTTQRFEGLNGHDGVFAGTGDNAGKQVVTVWVKAGANFSGDGPGYGERFDRPAGACDDRVDDSGGGGDCGGGYVCEDKDLCAGKEIDDGDLCTDDACDPKTGEVTHTYNTAPCDDGNVCSAGDRCGEGKCRPGPSPCQTGECKPTSGQGCGGWDDLECGQGGPVDDVAVLFGCTTVSVRSCKDLSNVVLLFADGTTQRFEGLSGHDGVFAGTGENAGKEIVTVWVKAGANFSGDGPGYGERFDRAPGACDGGVDDGSGGDDCGDGGYTCVGNDGCPDDPDKTEPGLCGCGKPDTDSDGDGTPDCNDACAKDPTRTEPSPEVCDGVDNDCDGTVDEDLTRATTCGQGKCAGNTGTETCT
ncbi:MAG: putative metal-binding motif-containing protein, partial [Deltaproteobacteria bacterium]|nr:putative metal-binding motif-containing protein [Deltaproteobacteria bacterium]